MKSTSTNRSGKMIEPLLNIRMVDTQGQVAKTLLSYYYSVLRIEILMPWSIVQRAMVEFLQPFLERTHQKSIRFQEDQD